MKELSTVVLYLVLFGLAAEVVVLGVQKRKQKEMIDDLLAGEDRPAPVLTALAVGDRLDPLPELAALDGSRQRLPFGAGQSRRLLLVFNTRCPACAETVASWNRLAGSVGERAQVVAVTSDPLEEIAEYRRQRNLSYATFSLGSADYKEVLQVGFVPQTILVDAVGTVLGIWSGPLSLLHEGRIENLLGVPRGEPSS